MVKLWDFRQNKPFCCIETDTPVQTLSWAPPAGIPLLASGGTKAILIWTVFQNTLQHRKTIVSAQPICNIYWLKGNRLVTIHPGSIQLWDHLKSCGSVSTATKMSSPSALSPDQKSLVTVSNSQLDFWKISK